MIENKIFWCIVNLIATTIEELVLLRMFDIYSKRKRQNLTIYLLLLIPIMTVQIFDFYGVDSNIKFLIVLIIDFIYCMYCYDNKIFKTILISGLYWMISMGIDLLVFSVVNAFNLNSNATDIMNSTLYRLELIIFSKIILMASVVVLRKLNLKNGLTMKQYLSVLIPIAANILFIVVIWSLVYKYIPNNLQINYVVLILAVLLILSNISILTITNNIVKENQLKIENEKIREKIDIQYNYYLNLKKEQEKIAKFRHDIKNHLLCIKNSATTEESSATTEESNEYIEKINLEINQNVVDFNTGNAILDAIFYEKSIICIDKKIKYKFDVDYSRCEFIDVIDTCSIFSNLLDNAIEACAKIDQGDKVIELKGNVANEFFVIKCENTKVNDVLYLGENITTDKEDKELHGIGLKSIRESFEKYGGDINIEVLDNKFILKGFISIK
ncbi:sensor histidine kinase [Thomasclavelia spiroformis]|uniref:sensor histidine kinase n=2 Tax=Bacillota TaxID=1239 RepID=UPI00241DF3A3|nr:sensor histidine kinase [Thomasclavelia spiroformis]MBS6686476.1 GHKL domain-containing protein [Thomasclavelia spiroformis]